MRYLAVLTALLFAAAAALATADAARDSQTFKMAICHKMKSAKKPYVRIVVRDRATLRAHSVAHHADIIPAPAAGCPSATLTADQGGRQLTATLTGAAEVPGPGDADGSGTASVRLRLGQGQICFRLTAAGITLPAAAAHIHVGLPTEAGPIVVPLVPPDATGVSSGCVNVARTLVRAILTNPSGYYVNVHTSDFPAGAIRGQLS
jgi:hypothetical protein